MLQGTLSLGWLLAVLVSGYHANYLLQLPGYHQWQSYLDKHAQYEKTVQNQLENTVDTDNYNDDHDSLSAAPAEIEPVNNIIEDQINTKDGLKEILKNVLINRINVQKEEKYFTTRMEDLKGETFLDKLSNIFNPTVNEVSQTFDLAEKDRNSGGRLIYENVFEYDESFTS